MITDERADKHTKEMEEKYGTQKSVLPEQRNTSQRIT